MTGQPVIIGWSHTNFGKLADTRVELMTQAATSAINNAGINVSDIDCIHVGTYNNGFDKQGFEGALLATQIPELALIPAHHHENACATGSAAAFAAYNAVASGRYKCALVVGVEKMTAVSGQEVNDILLTASYREEEEKYGSFAGVFGELATLYAERYSDPFEAMALIAAKNHKNGAANPLAHMQKDLGFEFCNTVSEKNPRVAGPLRRTDCSMVSDGAAALVIADKSIVDTQTTAIEWRGMGNANDALPLSARDPLAFTGAAAAMNQALDEAGVTLTDLDFLETHDCFTIAELLQYEAFGLAERGYGASVIECGMTALDGKLPVNPSGGLKAKGHPVGATGVSMLAISCMQLDGSFPGHQIPGAQLAGIFNMGGLAVSNFASVLERVS